MESIRLEGFSRESKQDAIAQALAGSSLEKREDERVAIDVLGLWEDEDGYRASIAVHHVPLSPEMNDNRRDNAKDLKDIVEREADEFMALLLPDVAHEYRREDEETETMKDDPHFEELHKKIEHDFDEAEHPPQASPPAPNQLQKATEPEPHVEGTAEEEKD